LYFGVLSAETAPRAKSKETSEGRGGYSSRSVLTACAGADPEHREEPDEQKGHRNAPPQDISAATDTQVVTDRLRARAIFSESIIKAMVRPTNTSE
jgi:hypothetical protein